MLNKVLKKKGRKSKKQDESINPNLLLCGLVVVIFLVIFYNKEYNNKKNGFINPRLLGRADYKHLHQHHHHIHNDASSAANNNTNNNNTKSNNKNKNNNNNNNNKQDCENEAKTHNHYHHNHQDNHRHNEQHNMNNPMSWFHYKDLKAQERIINPLLPPERSYENSYGVPINISSRGYAGGFQQIGALYKEVVESEDMKPGNNTESVQLALFGKETYPNSKKWSYYTTSDKHNAVKMPISHNGKKCDSRYGCDEIMDDELITIPGYNGMFRAVIYDYDAPKYIPYL